VTVGAQLGGQQYAEIIFFENKDALDSFKGRHFTMAAQVSAVAAAEGASANARFACHSPSYVESPLADFDGRIDRVGDRLSGHVIAHMTPGSPRLSVVGSVSGRDVRLRFGSQFVFSGTIEDSPDAATGAIAVRGMLIGQDVGPIPERLILR
jgi:hypothetical protein